MECSSGGNNVWNVVVGGNNVWNVHCTRNYRACIVLYIQLKGRCFEYLAWWVITKEITKSFSLRKGTYSWLCLIERRMHESTVLAN